MVLIFKNICKYYATWIECAHNSLITFISWKCRALFLELESANEKNHPDVYVFVSGLCSVGRNNRNRHVLDRVSEDETRESRYNTAASPYEPVVLVGSLLLCPAPITRQQTSGSWLIDQPFRRPLPFLLTRYTPKKSFSVRPFLLSIMMILFCAVERILLFCVVCLEFMLVLTRYGTKS